MPWTCLQCSATNPDSEAACRRCGAEKLQEPAAPDSPFTVPRRGELTAGLRQGLEGLRSGELKPEEMAERLRRATQNVPLVFEAVIGQLPGGSDEYSHGVIVSLEDCQALFETGIGDMLRGLEVGDPFPLRFGWLLVEKGEEEYIRILQALRRDASGGPFAGLPDALSQLVDAHQRGELDADQLRSSLDALEDHLSSILETSWDDIRQGIDRARSAGGEDVEALAEARNRLRLAAERLAEALLSLA